jgi:uncharacterized protein YerC
MKYEDIAFLLLQGKTYKTIASELTISEKLYHRKIHCINLRYQLCKEVTKKMQVIYGDYAHNIG